MRVGVDVDGCIRDIHSKLVQVYRREMGKDHWCDPPEKWRTYCVKDNFSIGEGIYDFWFKAHSEEIYTKALPYLDIDEIKKLYDIGHDIVVLTDQPNVYTEEYTLAWIRKYLPYVDEIHFTSKKYLVSCDVYLDDAPYHLNDFRLMRLKFVIMNRRWNQIIELDSFDRVDSLTEFKDFVLENV